MSIKNLTTEGNKDIDVHVGDVHTTKLFEDCGEFSMNYGVSTSITIDKPCGRIAVDGLPSFAAANWGTIYVTLPGYTEETAFVFVQTHLEQDDAWRMTISTHTFSTDIFAITFMNTTAAALDPGLIRFNFHVIFKTP